VVSETFARRHWPSLDPIGRTIKRGRPDDPRPFYVVVGVARTSRASRIRRTATCPACGTCPSPEPGFLTDDVTFVVHTRAAPEALERSVRQALGGVDPTVAPYNFTTVERMTGNSYVEDRFATLLIGLFGMLGLVLSALGLYGLLSFQVARRTRELGVRAALGARVGDIVSLVLRDGALLVIPGLALGLVGAFAVTRLLASQLHGVPPTDPLSYAVAAIVLCAAAGLAPGSRRAGPRASTRWWR
jgi:predicted lysophospholipase L1 biosynthesis ABC-type transport system permease subunit